MKVLIIVIGIFILILFGLILLRVKTGNKFEIKNSDIILALIPIVLWLLLTGKIKKFGLGPFTMEAAFVEASRSAIAPQITALKLPIEDVRMDQKTGIEEIPRLIERKTEALVFQLGYGGYWGPAIAKYLYELVNSGFLKYIIIEKDDGKLVGILSARELANILLVSDPRYTPKDFADWIYSSNVQALARLPTFVSAKNAINEDTNKQLALERMESLNIQTLPVIDKEGRFVGIVGRSRLTTSLIIDVARRISQIK